MPSVRKNALYNVVYQIVRLIFPIITYPYVSRIIGPEGIGNVSYAQTLANNFVTFGLLGIPIYAAREISKSRVNKQGFDSMFSEILVLSFFCSLVASACYFVLPVFNRNIGSLLFFLFGIDVVSSWLKLDWFYQGIEEFRYITFRNLLLRIISLFVMFLIIKTQEHYVRYGMLWIAGNLLSGIINLGFAFKFVKFKIKVSISGICRHLKKSLPSTLILISSFLYSSIDVLMLGWLLNDGKTSVGYYSVAARLTRIIISIVVAVNGAVAVRIALKKEQGKESDIIRYIRKNIDYVMFLALPCMLGISIIAKDFILVFAGDKFLASADTLRILCLEIVFIAFSGVIQNQVLYAQGRERAIVKTIVICLVVAAGLNAILIPRYTHFGAAIATLTTRIIEMGIGIWFGRRQLKQAFNAKGFLRLMAVMAVWFFITAAVYFWGFASTAVIFRLVATIAVSAVSYAVLCMIFKIEQFAQISGILFKKLKQKRES